MATIAWSEETPPAGEAVPAGVKVIKWVGLATSDVGADYLAPHFADKTVQVLGTFGGTSVTLQGHNFVTGSPSYDTLHDFLGADLTFTARGLKPVAENPYAIRPSVAAGGVATLIDVRLLVETQSRR